MFKRNMFKLKNNIIVIMEKCKMQINLKYKKKTKKIWRKMTKINNQS